jgi:hypothetical protein
MSCRLWGCLVAFPLGVVQAVMGLHSVGCSGWYIDAVKGGMYD